MKPAYRPEIDGLRAVAVMPVVLFHLGVPGFSGGFVGVDVFFVISGFLITSIIASEIDKGDFSILGFYERRIRRIFPALFVMLAVVLAAGYVLFLPSDYEALGKTALTALLSVSNFTFYEEAGYFDEVSVVKPLLHTWSLAVEEQFYLLLPPLLLFASRLTRYRTAIVAAIALASLAAAIAVTPVNQEFAFYLLPARSWELLAGSLLALRAVPAARGGILSELGAAAGLLGILAPVLLYDAKTLFPGLTAIPPVLGASLIIHFGHGTRIGGLLGRAPLRAIGLISYSLYLWHWPVIVAFHYWRQGGLAPLDAVLAVGLSVVLAALSWRFVERPFRRPGCLPRQRLWIATIASTAILGAAAVAVDSMSGIPSRFGSETAHFYRSNNVDPVTFQCAPLAGFKAAARNEACILGNSATPPTMAVWGDSHGMALASALVSTPAANAALLRFTKGGCPPSLAPVIYRKADCPPHNRQVADYLKSHPEITTVVVAAYFLSDRYAKDPTFADGYVEAVQALIAMGKQVVLVGPIPRQPFDASRKLSLATEFGQALPHGVSSPSFLEKAAPVIAMLQRAAGGKARIVWPNDMLCDPAECPVIRDGKALYTDDNHLSSFGAGLLAARIASMPPTTD